MSVSYWLHRGPLSFSTNTPRFCGAIAFINAACVSLHFQFFDSNLPTNSIQSGRGSAGRVAPPRARDHAMSRRVEVSSRRVSGETETKRIGFIVVLNPAGLDDRATFGDR